MNAGLDSILIVSQMVGDRRPSLRRKLPLALAMEAAEVINAKTTDHVAEVRAMCGGLLMVCRTPDRC
jgi:hypothetical protein